MIKQILMALSVTTFYWLIVYLGEIVLKIPHKYKTNIIQGLILFFLLLAMHAMPCRANETDDPVEKRLISYYYADSYLEKSEEFIFDNVYDEDDLACIVPKYWRFHFTNVSDNRDRIVEFYEHNSQVLSDKDKITYHKLLFSALYYLNLSELSAKSLKEMGYDEHMNKLEYKYDDLLRRYDYKKYLPDYLLIWDEMTYKDDLILKKLNDLERNYINKQMSYHFREYNKIIDELEQMVFMIPDLTDFDIRDLCMGVIGSAVMPAPPIYKIYSMIASVTYPYMKLCIEQLNRFNLLLEMAKYHVEEYNYLRQLSIESIEKGMAQGGKVTTRKSICFRE